MTSPKPMILQHQLSLPRRSPTATISVGRHQLDHRFCTEGLSKPIHRWLE
jgi:hypothetical protein